MGILTGSLICLSNLFVLKKSELLLMKAWQFQTCPTANLLKFSSVVMNSYRKSLSQKKKKKEEKNMTVSFVKKKQKQNNKKQTKTKQNKTKTNKNTHTHTPTHTKYFSRLTDPVFESHLQASIFFWPYCRKQTNLR